MIGYNPLRLPPSPAGTNRHKLEADGISSAAAEPGTLKPFSNERFVSH